MTLSLPTRYVNVVAAIVYNADLPDPLFRTYVRLAGLAWRDKAHDYTQLPALTLNELAACCHLKPRAMRLHLDQLQMLGYLTCTGTAASYVIQIQTPGVQSFTQVQSFTLHDDHDVVVDDPDLQREDQQQHDGKVQSFTLSANLDALQAFGVNPAIPDAQRVAALPHVTPEFIQAWGQELATARDTRNLPGRLLYKLQTTQQLPRVETRGRGHRPDPPPGASEKPTGPLLPPAILADLTRLGFTGPVDEVVAVYTRDPDFVTAWLGHCLRHAATFRNPAGTFRHSLRGEAYPPEPLALPAPKPLAVPSAAEQLWQRALQEMELQMTQATFNQWLRHSRGQDFAPDGSLRVLVNDPRAVGWLQGRLAPIIARAVSTVASEPLTVQFVLPNEAPTALGAAV